MALTNSVADIITLIRGLVKDQIKNDGQEVFEYSSDTKFTLCESFIDASSINVFKNTILMDEDDWQFNADTNQVEIDIITSGETLNPDDIILITFNYYKKYSDAEIEGYLYSSLSYFAQHNYAKIFTIINDYVVSINNISPECKEIYFIAIVASILIDPQNIEINTPEFKLTANRSESDQEQIGRAFMQFKKFTGTITFDTLDHLYKDIQ